METMTFNRKKPLFLQSRKNRIMFKFINIYLIIGVGSMLVTMYYLIGHLGQSDDIIIYCIPGFFMGISSGLVYFVGYHSLISGQSGSKSRYFSHK